MNFTKRSPRQLLLPAQFLLPAAARAQYDIGAPADGPFAAIGTFMQEFVDFIDGPFVLAFAVFSIIFCAGLYALSPKSGAAGMAMRVVIAVMIALNVATWIAYFQNNG